MSENLFIETDTVKYQNRYSQTVTLLSLFAIAVLLPYFCFTLFTFFFRGVQVNELPYLLLMMITFLFSPYAIGMQWEALLFTWALLAAIVFFWPEQFKGKAWCVGLVLFFHALVGGVLIYLRIS
ncbi:hypothetical protein Pan241w_34280 [Gimesia alba]|uniref:Uncharacterized protein n=1 Tax=Gimesia alba TaxID=2527973 RepID=A0A517RHI0_9PLAN|nr:hypothetical protein [Gimesia alba]QDT43328.1 hypothetical protein Pan241w_34280 [Gimesia alba]